MHNITDYITALEASKLTGLSKSTILIRCRSGEIEAVYKGQWLPLRTSAEQYKKQKPGLKLGQKIKRKRRGDVI